jgi:hypothetical protein
MNKRISRLISKGLISMQSGVDWLPKFWWDFFLKGPPKKGLQKQNLKKKKKVIK